MAGESNPNSWFAPKKLRAMGNHIEAMKNNHVGSNPVPAELQREMLKVMPGLSEYQYYNFRNREKQLVEYREFVGACDIDDMIKKMPAKLRKDIENAEIVPMPEIAEPILKYVEQLQVYLPQDERHRYNLLLKIQHPPKNKLEDDNSEN